MGKTVRVFEEFAYQTGTLKFYYKDSYKLSGDTM